MSDFNATFVNIRSALRLNYLYTQRVQDLVKYIRDLLDLQFQGGYVKHFGSPTPRNGKGNLENWAWDWVNIYLYEFNFTCKDKALFSILLESDTGFWDNENSDIFAVQKFGPVEKARTRLLFVYGDDYWNFDRVVTDEIMSGSSANEFEIRDGQKSGRMLIKIVNIEEFETKESTRAALEKVVSFLSGQGVDSLSIQEKEE